MTNGKAAYYGNPIVKPPEWTDLIPVYFWAGGMGGACASLALTQRVRRNDDLARTLVFGAAAATLVSAFCLIFDLKKPSRFMNMLRVFKPTSPMSMGTYVFSLFGGAVLTAAACEMTGEMQPLGRTAEAVAGAIGPVMSVYTAVLISDTAVPAWYLGRKTMPMLFAATSAATAGGFGVLFGPAHKSGAARRLAIAGAAAIPVALSRLHREVGTFQGKAYKEGPARVLADAARAANLAGLACILISGKLSVAARTGGALLLAAGLLERFAVMRAGRESAKNPAFTIDAQQPQAARSSGSAFI